MSKNDYKNLTLLGHQVGIPVSPAKAKLEKVAKPFSNYDYLVRLVCPEFTTFCPITRQPDFAHIVIDYVPGKYIIESKSLKLFLESFRNYGAFNEACTVMIGDRLLKSIAPKYLRVSAYWYPRGGIPIDVFFERGKLPKGVTVPDTGVANYRGRG